MSTPREMLTASAGPDPPSSGLSRYLGIPAAAHEKENFYAPEEASIGRAARMSHPRERVQTSHRYYGATSSIPARPRKNIFWRRHAGIGKPVPLIRQVQPTRPRPSRGDLEAMRFNANRRELTMYDQRDPTQDAVLRAQIATANRLIADQSVAIARAHSAIERAIERLREPDGERPSVC
jgi:hypothetical protein